MKIQNLILLEGKSEDPGVYVAVKYSKESQDALVAYSKSLKLDNLTPKDQYHTTIIYSTSPLVKGEKITPRAWSVKSPLIVKPKGLLIFKSTSDGDNALVLELESATLKRRHATLMKNYPSLSYSFDSYIPHITLSYDVGKDYIVPDKLDFKLIKTLEVVEEYVQPLNLNWKDELK